MRNKGAFFDGVYSVNKKNEKCPFVLYDQIYKDFKIKRCDVKLRVLALASINLDNEEIKNTKKENLLFN